MSSMRRFTAAAAVSVGVAGVLPAAGAASAAPADAGKPATTSKVEAARVDRVPAPRLHWVNCYTGLQCATAKLPLDYDHLRRRHPAVRVGDPAAVGSGRQAAAAAA